MEHSRNVSQRSSTIEAYAVPNRPGFKFTALQRNDSTSTYRNSVHKFIQSRNETSQEKPIFATNAGIEIEQQNVTGRFPGQFASQLNNRTRKATLGIDMSAANLLSYAQGEILIDP